MAKSCAYLCHQCLTLITSVNLVKRSRQTLTRSVSTDIETAQNDVN